MLHGFENLLGFKTGVLERSNTRRLCPDEKHHFAYVSDETGSAQIITLIPVNYTGN